MTTPTKYDDRISFADITDRVEELEEERDDIDADNAQDALVAFDASDDGTELALLLAFLEECQGNGGDHQWRGDWYPDEAIRDSYFRDYAQELAEDIGAIPENNAWPCTCIDWDQAARELQQDYISVTFDGVDYWVR